MARLLALEWDGREARVAVGREGGRGIVIEDAFSVELAPRNAGETFTDINIGERLSSALSARNIGRAETLVGVGRAGIELRVLNVPPAPDDELPEMVRFQAMRQFTALGDDWAMDFVPLAGDDEGETSVLAAAIPPDLVTQINDICGIAELSPKRLILRPFAAASLVKASASNRCTLMIDLLADEADLTVMVDQQVVFIRTVRLGGHDASQTAKQLVGEVRRTMVAAQNQLGGRRVEEVILCGTPENHGELKSTIEEDLSLGVELFNPFDNVALSSRLKKQLPENPGRYAPLLGMLADEATQTRHQIDFLNPRRKPEPADRKRLYVIATAAVVLALVSGAALVWLQLRSLDNEIQQLTEQNIELEKLEKSYDKPKKKVEDLENWVAGDISWLDELGWVSASLPNADQAVVKSMTANVLTTNGEGLLRITGLVRGGDTAGEITRSLTDDRHEVRSKGTAPVKNADGYTNTFNKTLIVQPHKNEEETPAKVDPAAVAKRDAVIDPEANR